MKLEGAYRDRLYASSAGSLLTEETVADERPRFGRRNDLPSLAASAHGPGVGERLRTDWPWKRLVEAVVGRFPTVNVRRLGDEDLVATVGRFLFSSHDDARTWTLRHELPESSGTMGVLPSGICVTDGAVHLGEYPLAEGATPRILRSTDDGRSWEVVLETDRVRHFHSIQQDPFTGELWVTTGDRDEECMIARLSEGGLDPLGGGSQHWRAVELAFTPSAVLWGVDCAFLSRNPVYRLDREVLEGDHAPEPVGVHSTDGSVYYAAVLPLEGEYWVVFSTAIETGTDSTSEGNDGSHGRREPDGGARARVLAASSASEFTEWHELATFRKSRRPADLFGPPGPVPIANAYVFVTAVRGRGVFLNPYNTRSDGIEQLGSGAFDAPG